MTSRSYRAAITTSMILATITLSLVVITGYAGQISLAQLTLAGAGAFALNRLTLNMHVPFPIAPLLAGVVAMVIGVTVGLPALRVRGLPVAIVTFALAVTLQSFWFQNAKLSNGDHTEVVAPKLFGLNLAVGVGKDQNRFAFGAMCLVVLLLTGASVAWLRRSSLGAAMLAVRANERAAAAAGIDVSRTKVAAFAIGSFIAGLGGSMLAYQQTRANESSFSPVAGLFFFGSAYLAGITSINGALTAGFIGLGGVFYTLITKNFHPGLWYEAAMGCVLVFNVVKYPEGLSTQFHETMERVANRREARHPRLALRPLASTPHQASVAAISGRPALILESVGVRYGGVVAIDSVSLNVPEGLIVGLIGPNGAGKTTLIDAISGYAQATGKVTFDGHPLDGLKPRQRIRAGLGRTFQSIELYDDLSVRENIAVGEAAVRHGSARGTNRSIEELCQLLDIADFIDRPLREMSHGQRQLVSIARALAGAPKLLLLDEPAAGLDTGESQLLGERLRTVRDAGVTILLVDHDMHLVLSLCDYIHVLDLGSLVASGNPEEVKANPIVAAAYLGEEVPA